MAIAAPTPISALVHSSTLVTAGLFLLMRFSYLVYYNCEFVKFLLICRIFTSFYAGINVIFEMDLKKLIALSTLSHLGFIGMSYSCGMLHLAFFHLLVHALFKSLLFMAMGDIITNLGHSQDIRYLSSGFAFTPFSKYVMYVSLLNLLGIPRLRGYFSKDLVLETFRFSRGSFLLYFLVLIGVFFTYYYTYKLFFFSFQRVKMPPYSNLSLSRGVHSFLLVFLGLRGIMFGGWFVSEISYTVIFPRISLFFKFVPIVLNLFLFRVLVILLKLPTLKHQLAVVYFSGIIFLFQLITGISSNLYLQSVAGLSKGVEVGVGSFFMNTSLGLVAGVFSSRVMGYGFLNQMKLVVVFVFFVVVILYVLRNNIKKLCMIVNRDIPVGSP